MELNKRQSKLLEYIKTRLAESGFPPTFSEMAKAVGVKSKNAVEKMLRKLEVLGMIEREKASARGIRLLNREGDFIGAGQFAAPVVGAVAAGSPILAEENIETWVNLPTTLTHNRRDVFILKVRGMSMKDAGILDGDLVIVSPGREVRHRDIVVALIEGEATVKRYVNIDGRKYLKAENPAYKNIHPQSEWTIAGKVVGVIRNME